MWFPTRVGWTLDGRTNIPASLDAVPAARDTCPDGHPRNGRGMSTSADLSSQLAEAQRRLAELEAAQTESARAAKLQTAL